MAAGCSPATDVSRQPSQNEIQEGVNRRLAEIEKLQIPEAAKERMRQQANGQIQSGRK